MPGHGRARVDSHRACRGSRPAARCWRTAISRRSARSPAMPWAMTAHIVYTAIDAARAGDLVAAGHRRRHPRRDRLRRRAGLRRSLDGRARRRARRAHAPRARRRLRSRPALQRRSWPRWRRSPTAAPPISPRPRRGSRAARRCAVARREDFDRARRRGALRRAADGARRRSSAAVNADGATGRRWSMHGDHLDPAGHLRGDLSRGGARLRRLSASATTPPGGPAASPSTRCKHIDPFGTILLPALLILLRSPFLFGYAKPVPVNFGRLQPSAARHGAGRAGRAGDQRAAGDRLVAAVLRRRSDAAAARPTGWRATWSTRCRSTRCCASSTCCRCRRSMAAGSRSGCCRGALALPLARLEPYGMLILMLVCSLLSYVGARSRARLQPARLADRRRRPRR